MLLEASGLVADVPGEHGPVRVLDGLALTLDAGDLLDVTGPSGAGKTTLLRALARLLPGAGGRLVLEGRPAESWTATAWRAKVALLPQRPALWPGSVRENLLTPWALAIRHGHTPPADADLRAALDGVGLSEIDLSRDAARLSVGQASRVALLRVILTRPDVLLLDEPDAALDDASARQVEVLARRFVAEGGAVVRVRHAREGGGATRRLTLSAGRLMPGDRRD